MIGTNAFIALLFAGMLVPASTAAPQPQAPSRPAYDGSASPNAMKEIHIGQDCRILPDPSQIPPGKKVRGLRDPVICHLEGAHDSEHMEETIVGDQLYRNRVRIVEQEYVLQNVATGKVIFLVEKGVPEGWVVDSDPQPAEIVNSIAVFPVYADPGQIVRLHVGLRHAQPLKTKAIKTSPLAPSGH